MPYTTDMKDKELLVGEKGALPRSPRRGDKQELSRTAIREKLVATKLPTGLTVVRGKTRKDSKLL